VARGVRGFDDSNGFLKSAQLAVADAFSKASSAQLADSTLLKEYLRLELKRFIQAQTGSRPVITPVVQQI
jgi:ribonuclease J